ncbi:MAG: GGDEF domain-containing protein [Spirochaetales bacterium]|nr:GGDEF domain-containing protein [Spirochaetales bacterium]
MKVLRNSIRWEIFFNSILTALIILFIFSLIFSRMLRQAELDKASEIIRERNLALNFYVDGFMSKINDSIEILAADLQVQNGPYLDPAETRALLERYKSYSWTNRDIAYIYSAYENGLLLINDYVEPEGFNPLERPWYIAAQEKAPHTSIGVPYREIKDNQWLVSSSRAFPGGVVVIDASLDKIAALLDERASRYDTAYSLILSPDWNILIHNNHQFLGQSIASYMDEQEISGRDEGRLEYSLDGVDKIAYFSRSEIADWYIMTVVNLDEILSPLPRIIIPRIILIALIAVFLGLIQSYYLRIRFFTPIQNLYRHVTDIINGTAEPEEEYDYPSNEIGVIAAKLSGLAEKELYTLSQELKKTNMLLEEKNRELEILSAIDKLSGLYNRRQIDEELEKIHQMSSRYGRGFAVLLLDLDHFKAINDNHGHAAGDAVIRDVGDILRRYLRPTDIAGRWGGEEFIVISPECDEHGLAALGNKILKLVAGFRFSAGFHITTSIGGALSGRDESLEELLLRADQNLYSAKREGRNRFIM